MSFYAQVKKRVSVENEKAEKAWRRWEDILRMEHVEKDSLAYGLYLLRRFAAISAYCQIVLESRSGDEAGIRKLLDMIEEDFSYTMSSGEGQTWPGFKDDMTSQTEKLASEVEDQLKLEDVAAGNLSDAMRVYWSKTDELFNFEVGDRLSLFARLSLHMAATLCLVARVVEERVRS